MEGFWQMARKQYSAEQAVAKLQQIDVLAGKGKSILHARKALNWTSRSLISSDRDHSKTAAASVTAKQSGKQRRAHHLR